MSKTELEIGERNGRLEVIWKTDVVKHKKPYWHCRCDCGADLIMNNRSFNRMKSCGCESKSRGGAKFGGMEFTVFTKSSIRLKNGFTYLDYTVKYNEDIPICKICHALGVTLDDVRRSYDKTFGLKTHEVGRLYHPRLERMRKEPKPLMCAERKQGTLQTVVTGADWRKV